MKLSNLLHAIQIVQVIFECKAHRHAARLRAVAEHASTEYFEYNPVPSLSELDAGNSFLNRNLVAPFIV